MEVEIAQLKAELEALNHPLWVEHIKAKDAELAELRAALNKYSEDEMLCRWETEIVKLKAELAELRESEAMLLRIIRDFRASNERLKAFSVELLNRLSRRGNN